MIFSICSFQGCLGVPQPGISSNPSLVQSPFLAGTGHHDHDDHSAYYWSVQQLSYTVDFIFSLIFLLKFCSHFLLFNIILSPTSTEADDNCSHRFNHIFVPMCSKSSERKISSSSCLLRNILSSNSYSNSSNW